METVLIVLLEMQGKAPRADTESAPTVQGTMLVIPNKSLKQKIPEQTFEDFGADEGI